MMGKRWPVILLIAALTFSMVAGCSTSTTSSENEGKVTSGGKISGKLEIQYFVGGYGDDWWKAVIKDFKTKYPDVQVVEDAGPDINTKMKPRWISGSPPDLVYIDGDGLSETQMVQDGQFMNLTDWIKTFKLPNGTQAMDSFIVPPNQFKNGEIYSFPLFVDMWGTWYDKAWFEKQGYKAPTGYQSWMNTMKDIKEKGGISPFITTGMYPYYFLYGVLYPAIAAAGGDELLTKAINGDEGVWKSEKVLDVMKKVQKMVEAGYIDPGFAALSHTQSQMNFLLHKNAFIPVGFWLPKEMEKDMPKGMELNFTPTPMNNDGEPMAVVPDARSLAIAKKAKNPAAAKAFIEFAFQEKYAKKFASLAGALMDMKGIDLASDPNVPSYLKHANEMINSKETKIYFKPHEMDADLSKPIDDALVALLLGKIDAKEFCQRAEDAAKNYRNSK